MNGISEWIFLSDVGKLMPEIRNFPTLGYLNRRTMAKRSRKQQRYSKLDRRDNRKFFLIVGIATVMLLVMLYLIYQSS